MIGPLWQQQTLSFGSRWGGARVGAGRPRKAGRSNVAHRARPPHRKDWPVLVTLRTGCRSLRSQFVYPTVRGAIAATKQARSFRPLRRASSRRDSKSPWSTEAKAEAEAEVSFRVCEFSVQDEHIHLLVEASSRLALERGIRGLSIRLAKRVNQLLFQQGRFISDRYHAMPLKTPRAVRNALVYVIGNFRKHGHGRGRCGRSVDPYSSAPYFGGFVEFADVSGEDLAGRLVPQALAPPSEAPVERARTWLLGRGWLRYGKLSVWEEPKKE